MTDVILHFHTKYHSFFNQYSFEAIYVHIHVMMMKKIMIIMTIMTKMLMIIIIIMIIIVKIIILITLFLMFLALFAYFSVFRVSIKSLKKNTLKLKIKIFLCIEDAQPAQNQNVKIRNTYTSKHDIKRLK